VARGGERWISLGPLRGQNSTENPLTLGPGWASDTENITLNPESAVAMKRRGSTVLATPVGTYMLARFKAPGDTEDKAQLFAFVGDAGRTRVYRQFAGQTTWNEIAVPSPVSFIYRWVVFNGKMFFGALTTDNNLYCFENNYIRTVGIHPNAPAPTVANQGTGSYPAIGRYYKIDYIIRDANGRLQARSEPGFPSALFTPSGTGLAARVFPWDAGGAPGSWAHSTHFRVWGSSDGVTYYKLSGDILGGASGPGYFDDTTVPTYYGGEQLATVGTFLPPPSALRVMTDGNRLLMARSGAPFNYVQTPYDSPHVPKSNRVWYTPVLGSADQGDDERVPLTTTQRNFLDLGENTNDGAITEMDGPMDGQLYVFSQRRIWRLVPTGDLVTPYLTYSVSDRYGAQLGFSDLFVRAVAGEDEQGNPAIYFSSEYGLYRVGARNIQFVSFDITSQIRAIRDAETYDILWLMSYPQRKQLWIWVNHHIWVFHWDQGHPDQDGDIRGGWTHWIHADTTNTNYGFSPGVLHNAVPGGTSVMAMRLVPYVAPNTVGNSYIFERNEARDGSNIYNGWVKFAPLVPTNSEQQLRVGNGQLIARAGSSSIRVSASRDFGTSAEEVRYDDISLVSDIGAPRVIRTLEALLSGDVTVLEITLGEPTPQSVIWQVDLLRVPIYSQESR